MEVSLVQAQTRKLPVKVLDFVADDDICNTEFCFVRLVPVGIEVKRHHKEIYLYLIVSLSYLSYS